MNDANSVSLNIHDIIIDDSTDFDTANAVNQCNCPCGEFQFSTHPLENYKRVDNGMTFQKPVAPSVIQLRRHMNTGVQPEYECEITDAISELSLSGWASAHKHVWVIREIATFVFEISYGPSARAGTFRIDRDDHKIISFEWNPEWRNLITDRGKEILDRFVGLELRYPIEGNLLEIKNSPVGTHVYNRAVVSGKGE